MSSSASLSCVVIRPVNGLLPWQLACVDLLGRELDVTIAGWLEIPGASSAPDKPNIAARWLDGFTRPRMARQRQLPERLDTNAKRTASGRNPAREHALTSEDADWIREQKTDFVLAFDTKMRLQGYGPLASAGVWQFSEGGAPADEPDYPGVAALARRDTRLTLSLWAQTDTQKAPILVAQGHTPAVLHSRKRALARLYEIAPDLLRRGVDNMRAGNTPALSSPWDIVEIHQSVGWPRFVAAMLRETLRRWVEKVWLRQRWDIGLIEVRTAIPSAQQIAAAHWLAGPKTGFWADPCFVAGAKPPKLLVEEYRDDTGKGEITRLDWTQDDISAVPPTTHPLLRTREHLSFPRSYTHNQDLWLVPEMAAGGEQRAYPLNDNGQLSDAPSMPIHGLVGIDPVLFTHASQYWAFISPPGRRANYQLDLYLADDFFGPYRRHPASPVRIDPHGGRSAGPVIHDGTRLLRFGQVFGRYYGEAIDVFEIMTLTSERYAERRVGRIQPTSAAAAGMHTIDFSTGFTVIDRFRLVPAWRLVFGRLQ